MNKKYYVKQVYCEDNSFYYDILKQDIEENDYNNIFIWFSKHNGINNNLIDVIRDGVIGFYEYDLKYYYKNNVAALVIDVLKKYKKLSLKQAINIAAVIKKYDSQVLSMRDAVCDILSIIYNCVFKSYKMTGCCQGDAALCFYNSENVNDKYLMYIEDVIFNLGCEIEIHDENTIPATVEDISGYYDYIAIYDHRQTLKQAICDYLNAIEDDVVFYEICDVKYRQVIDINYDKK